MTATDRQKETEENDGRGRQTRRQEEQKKNRWIN